MNKVPEQKKLIKVVSNECLPTRNNSLLWAVIYHLADMQYDFIVWIDMVVYISLALWFLASFERVSREVAVDIFKE